MPSDLKLALIGGSGLADALDAADADAHDLDTPFGKPSAPVLETTLDGLPVLLLKRHGEGHVHNPAAVPYRANIFALKQLGATHVIASGACGSLREEFAPRDLVIPDSTLDRTTSRPRTFYEKAAVHVEFADPFCPVLRRLLLDAAGEAKVHDGGTYVCMEGPAFSTRAESHAHRLLGGGVVGMTLLPEARLAKEAELPYAAVCLVTDYDCWKERDPTAGHDPFALLTEIVGHLKAASDNAMALIRRAATLANDRREELASCPAREALTLGIWTKKDAIDRAEVERLRPLWGRHFES